MVRMSDILKKLQNGSPAESVKPKDDLASSRQNRDPDVSGKEGKPVPQDKKLSLPSAQAVTRKTKPPPRLIRGPLLLLPRPWGRKNNPRLMLYPGK